MNGREIRKWLKRIGVYVLTAILMTQPIAGAFVVSGATTDPEIVAETEPNEDGFDIQDGVLVKYSGTAEEVTIPDEVVSIKEDAFNNIPTIKKVVMPDSLETIEARAFYNCTNLTEVEFGKNVRTIGNNVFLFCDAIQKVVLPVFTSKDQTDGITDSMFYVSGTERLSVEFVIPSESTYIPVDAFRYDSAKITMENNNERLSVVDNCVFATEIVDGIEVKKLIRVPGNISGDFTIPTQAQIVASDAFAGTKIKGTLTIPEEYTTVEIRGIAGCVVQDVVCNAAFTNLARDAFYHKGLGRGLNVTGKVVLTPTAASYNATIASEVIGGFLFGYKLYIPQEIESFNTSWISSTYCEYITVEEGNEKYVSIDGILYEKTGEMIGENPELKLIRRPNLLKPAGGVLTIQDGVTAIANQGSYSHGFSRNSVTSYDGNLVTKVEMSDDLVSIGSSAFEYNAKLAEIDLGAGVESIGANAFKSLAGSCKLVLPETMKENLSLGSWALAGVTELVASDALTPELLQKIINPAVSPMLSKITINDGNPNFMEKDGSIYSKDGSVLYFAASSTDGKFMIPDGVEVIAPYAFAGDRSSNLEVTLPDGIEKIETNAFAGTSATKITVHAGDETPQIADKAMPGVSMITLEKRAGSVYDYAVANKIPYTSEGGNIVYHVSGINKENEAEELSKDRLEISVQKADGTMLENVTIEDGYILLQGDDSLSAGDVLTLLISDTERIYRNAKVDIILDEKCNGSANDIQMIQRLYLTVETEEEEAKVYLYDADGNYIDWLFRTENEFVREIEPGSYQLLLHRGPASIFRQETLSAIDEMELVEGVDYTLVPITVAEDDITIKNPVIPEYVETNTLYSKLKSYYKATYNTLRECYDIELHLVRTYRENEYINRYGWCDINVSLPDGFELIEDSVKTSNSALWEDVWVNAYEGDVVLSYSKDYKEDTITFSIQNTTDQMLDSFSDVTCPLSEETIAATTLEDAFVSLNLPAHTAYNWTTVNGHGNPNSKVTIYQVVEGQEPVLLEETFTNEAGYYMADIFLGEIENGDKVTMYAFLTDEEKDVTAKTEEKTIGMLFGCPDVMGIQIKNWGNTYNVDPFSGKGSVISYNPSYTTTFEFELWNDSVVKRLILHDAKQDIELCYDATLERWVGQSYKQYFENEMELFAEIEDENGETQLIKVRDINIKWIIDPSGYIYEAFPDQRIVGATVTAYDATTNYNGRIWDAEPYLQQNPLTTGEDGTYAWDVPKGKWFVEVKKAGYYTSETDYFEIPPVRTDINIELKPQGRMMKITAVELSENGMQLTFDTYMRVDSVTAENLQLLADETPMTVVSVTPVDERTYNKTTKVAKQFLFTFEEDLKQMQPEDGYTLQGDSNEIHEYCYTGSKIYCQMGEIHMTGLKVSGIAESLTCDETTVVTRDGNYVITVQASPADAVKGKSLAASALDGAMIEVVKTTTFGMDGKATLVLKGSQLGQTKVTVSVEGTGLSDTMDVIVARDASVMEEVCDAANVIAPETLTDEEVEAITDPKIDENPEVQPSIVPSEEPSAVPSEEPSAVPSEKPSVVPSETPSAVPSEKPSVVPSAEPSVVPSEKPSVVPSAQPSVVPSTKPSAVPSSLPSAQPSKKPGTGTGGGSSTVASPTPSEKPSVEPSSTPSNIPSEEPSAEPSETPSEIPSAEPSKTPSEVPSAKPSEIPSEQPSVVPSEVPSEQPSVTPSAQPSEKPSVAPVQTSKQPEIKAPAKSKIKKATVVLGKSNGKHKIELSWKKVSKADGYEIRYSKDKNFKKSKTKTLLIKKGSTTKATIKKLKTGTWYVTVRAYKNVKVGKKVKKLYSEKTKTKAVSVKNK